MSIFTRPPSLESFIQRPATLPTALLGAALLLAPGGCDKGESNKTDTKAVGRAPAAKTPPGAKELPPEPVDDNCCRYCFKGTPCGDECLPEGKKCDKPEGEGCACTKDKRPAKKFPDNYRLRGGDFLLGPDVWNYNISQGDPTGGPFTLEMAFEGAPELADKSKGKLTATFKTSMGAFECELYEDQAPFTVANFVGLARGVRPYKDPRTPKVTDWVEGPYYDGTIFHRVIAGFMLQGGDPTTTGMGTPGYLIPDEFDPKLRHDGPGYLSMANRNPYDKATQRPKIDVKTGLTIGNTGSAQFFVTVNKTTQLDDRHTIFGKCETELPIAISKVPVLSSPQQNKPKDNVTIETITFSRK